MEEVDGCTNHSVGGEDTLFAVALTTDTGTVDPCNAGAADDSKSAAAAEVAEVAAWG